ncbi:hypothetical protein O1M54_19755 [Streptomyces diastatochromogenes]|nr:hypothetical protein [Streptomyces diastatochromogenes]
MSPSPRSTPSDPRRTTTGGGRGPRRAPGTAERAADRSRVRSPSTRPGHPATAKDTLAHCRAYEQIKDRGKALEATAWQRLVTAAGGEENVAAYCSEQIALADGANKGKSDKPHNSGNGHGSSESAKSGSGGKADSKAAGSANSGKSGGKK